MNKLQNAVNLIGRTGITPTIRTFENGMKLAKFSLATNETVSEVNGKKTLTQWHDCVPHLGHRISSLQTETQRLPERP